MRDRTLPFDTSCYDKLPVSCLVYRILPGADGDVGDYELVYGNEVFCRDWKNQYGNREIAGARFVRDRLLSRQVLRLLEENHGRPRDSFTAYLPRTRWHINFQPIPGLPEPYGGFLMANITDYEAQEGRGRLLRSVEQMNTNSVLLRQGEGGKLEALYVSDSFAAMMGYAPKDSLKRVDGLAFFRTAHPEDRPLLRSMMKRRVSESGNSDLVIKLLTEQRRELWCSIHFAFLEDREERYILCTYTDITLYKRYEEQLRSVYANLGSSFLRMDEHTLVLLRVNLSKDRIDEVKGADLYASDTQRLPYSESLRRRSESFPLVGERERFLKLFQPGQLLEAYTKGETSVSQVLFSVRPDGHSCYVDFSVSLARHPLSGDLMGFFSERECNREKVWDTLLRHILVRQFDMVAYLVDGRYGVTIGTPESVTRGSIFPRTPSGSYREYLEGQVLPVLSGTREQREKTARALGLEAVLRGVREHQPYIVNVPIDIQGETYYKRFYFYTVDPETDFLVVLKSDTTELHREQTQRNEHLSAALAQAQQANRAKTAFLSSMSHEIRTPMNAIIGLNSIALKEPELPERVRDHLEKIDGSARHLLSLINDILDMSRIESGRMTLKAEEFSFSAVVEQLRTMIGGQCRERGIGFTCSILGQVGEYYIGDDLKLKQVLLNILGNAVKFTPAPGSVTFLVEQLSSFGDQATLRFTIRDTGIGMDRDFLPRLFEAFSQEDSTTTNRYGGSGLGMAITKNLVEMMNGSITVDSEKRRGTEFVVTVPLRTSQRRAQPPEEDTLSREEQGPADAKLAGRRVLLAEDMPINAEIIIELLEMAQLQVDHAENGQLALEQFEAHPPFYYDAVLMDMRMPVLDGLGAAKAIRALEREDAKTIPIIALTANAFDEDVQRSLQAGINAHLTKPVEPALLYDTLSELIR